MTASRCQRAEDGEQKTNDTRQRVLRQEPLCHLYGWSLAVEKMHFCRVFQENKHFDGVSCTIQGKVVVTSCTQPLGNCVVLTHSRDQP